MGNKLYVGNLSYNIRDDDLQQAFAQYGTVSSAKVMMDRDTGRSKGFGFVEMGSDPEAQAAINGERQALDGRACLQRSPPAEERPGGSVGGGGQLRRRRWRRWSAPPAAVLATAGCWQPLRRGGYAGRLRLRGGGGAGRRGVAGYGSGGGSRSGGGGGGGAAVTERPVGHRQAVRVPRGGHRQGAPPFLQSPYHPAPHSPCGASGAAGGAVEPGRRHHAQHRRRPPWPGNDAVAGAGDDAGEGTVREDGGAGQERHRVAIAARQRRVDVARSDRDDPHPVLAQLAAQALAVADDRRLARAIGAVSRHSPDAADAGDADQSPTTALTHGADERMEGGGHADHIGSNARASLQVPRTAFDSHADAPACHHHVWPPSAAMQSRPTLTMARCRERRRRDGASLGLMPRIAPSVGPSGPPSDRASDIPGGKRSPTPGRPARGAVMKRVRRMRAVMATQQGPAPRPLSPRHVMATRHNAGWLRRIVGGGAKVALVRPIVYDPRRCRDPWAWPGRPARPA